MVALVARVIGRAGAPFKSGATLRLASNAHLLPPLATRQMQPKKKKGEKEKRKRESKLRLANLSAGNEIQTQAATERSDMASRMRAKVEGAGTIRSQTQLKLERD